MQEVYIYIYIYIFLCKKSEKGSVLVSGKKLKGTYLITYSGPTV